MGEMETWERCLWALRLEVEPAIVNDVTKHITEKIDALRAQLAAAERRNAALVAVLRYVDQLLRDGDGAGAMAAVGVVLAGSADAPATGGDGGRV